MYAALALVVALLGARALRADRSVEAAPPAAVVEGADGAAASEAGAQATGAPASDEPIPGSEASGAVPGPTPGGGGNAGPPSPGEAGGQAAPRGPDVLVHVAGAVRRPGVYRMPAGARVQDAVTSAGGARRGADAHRLNLAAKLADGQQVLVPRRGQRTSPAPGVQGSPAAAAPAGSGTAAAGTPGGAADAVGERIDLNNATVDELETLDGVGPAIAQKIVAWREANGGFRSVDDLAQVAGIGPKKLEAMRPRVRV